MLTKRGKLNRAHPFHKVGNDRVYVPGIGRWLPLVLPSVFDFCKLIAAEENGPDNFSPNRFPKDKISVGMSELDNIFV